MIFLFFSSTMPQELHSAITVSISQVTQQIWSKRWHECYLFSTMFIVLIHKMYELLISLVILHIPQAYVQFKGGCCGHDSYGSWIYNYLCNQCLSPLKLRVLTPFTARCTQYNIMW